MIAARAVPLIESGEVTVLFAGEGAERFAGVRPASLSPSLYTGASYRSAAGAGWATLLEAAMDHAREHGAARIDLNTSVDDIAGRALDESAGFTNR